jgi:hypothetical protein
MLCHGESRHRPQSLGYSVRSYGAVITLQITFPTSSATRSAPSLSMTTPGGMPSVNGTKITW